MRHADMYKRLTDEILDLRSETSSVNVIHFGADLARRLLDVVPEPPEELFWNYFDWAATNGSFELPFQALAHIHHLKNLPSSFLFTPPPSQQASPFPLSLYRIILPDLATYWSKPQSAPQWPEYLPESRRRSPELQEFLKKEQSVLINMSPLPFLALLLFSDILDTPTLHRGVHRALMSYRFSLSSLIALEPSYDPLKWPESVWTLAPPSDFSSLILLRLVTLRIQSRDWATTPDYARSQLLAHFLQGYPDRLDELPEDWSSYSPEARAHLLAHVPALRTTLFRTLHQGPRQSL